MTIAVDDATERAMLDAGLAMINGGSGDASGDFIVMSSIDTILATLAFSATAFAAATSAAGTATASSNAISNSGTPTAGTIAKAAFRDKANVQRWTFSVTASGGGGDMIVADPVIPANATAVTCSGITVTLNVTNA